MQMAISKVSRITSHKEMKRLCEKFIKHIEDDHRPSATFIPFSVWLLCPKGQIQEEKHTHIKLQ